MQLLLLLRRCVPTFLRLFYFDTNLKTFHLPSTINRSSQPDLIWQAHRSCEQWTRPTFQIRFGVGIPNIDPPYFMVRPDSYDFGSALTCSNVTSYGCEPGADVCDATGDQGEGN